jgi:hypothetical protein
MFLTISYNLKHFTFIFLVIILILTISTIVTYYTMDDNDLANLPQKNKNILIDDRFISIFYYNASIHGGLGDSLIYPKSNKAKIYTAIYLVLIAAGILTAIEI